jgi:hypothetical protein
MVSWRPSGQRDSHDRSQNSRAPVRTNRPNRNASRPDAGSLRLAGNAAGAILPTTLDGAVART